MTHPNENRSNTSHVRILSHSIAAVLALLATAAALCAQTFTLIDPTGEP
jgi:hypothetical protein